MTSTTPATLPLTLFDPTRLPPLDEDGWFMHPDLGAIYGDDEVSAEDARKRIEQLGWETEFVSGEDEATDEDSGEYRVKKWHPESPNGEGWWLVSIYDTEDGPYAQFVRPRTPAPAPGPSLQASTSSSPSPAADHGALHASVQDFEEAARAYGISFGMDVPSNDARDKLNAARATLEREIAALRSAHAAGWRPIDSAPKDGTAFLAYGRHAEDHVSHRDDAPKKGDHWWAIILWDVWREPRFVFSKDGAATWGEPTHWQPLPSPPK